MRLKPGFVFSCFLSLFFVFQITMAQNVIIENDITSNNLDEIPADSTVLNNDTTSLEADSTKKSNAIDAPILYAAQDSMVMTLDGKNMLYLYGQGTVKYQNMDLAAEYIEVDADSTTLFATFGIDSIGDEFGWPDFKEGESQYEMKKVRYNFKTKKMFITDVITQQGEGYISGGTTKKTPNDDLHMKDVRYTTCDDPDHPHFYLHMTKGIVQPNKNVVSGPVYLVVEDVPLPIAFPFAFFPFSSDYSSGIIMPSYGDEMRRGFSLRGGGYYFAFNDHVDMSVTGEIYTKGSWGLDVRSNYKKRYKYSGGFNANYIVTVDGEKGDPDYNVSKAFKVNWSHTQDPKSNPFSTFSVNVDFSTSQYNRNQMDNIYSSAFTENQKSSSMSWTYKHPNIPVNFRTSAKISQISRDSTVSVTLPDMAITVNEFYPFKRKDQVGDQRWYEKIRMSYSGTIQNRITNVKEYEFFKKNMIKDWQNGMRHSIPISASFNFLKHITITPSINYTERWYSNKEKRGYDFEKETIIPIDTLYGFYRVYDYSASVSMNTKLYGMYKPWSFLGKWTKGIQIRHVMTPSISFSGAPDFSNPKYGFYEEFAVYDPNGNLSSLIEDPNFHNGNRVDGTGHNKGGYYKYSPYERGIYGVPGQGKTGSLSFSVENNVEMKLPIAGTDSSRIVSIIDNLRLSSGYNFLKDSLNWSDISAGIRLKLGSYTLNLNATFDMYTYNYYTDANERIYVYKQNKTFWQDNKIFPRLISTGTSFSYSINNQTLKNLFKKKGSSDSDKGKSSEEGSDSESPPGESADAEAPRKSLREGNKDEDEYDADGYMLFSIPWNLSVSYSLNVGQDRSTSSFNTEKRQYPYKITQSASLSGNISPTKNWNFNFSTSFDFTMKQFVHMSCSLTRKMHCWDMSASFSPVGPYKSYSFTIRVNSSMLQDLKYTQSSNYRDALDWGI